MKADDIILATNGKGMWVQLTPVESVEKMRRTQMLSPKGHAEKKTLDQLVGIPVMFDLAGNVWPKPSEGWSLWQATSWKRE